MNSSVTRTELLAFWNWIDCQASTVETHVVAGLAERPGLLLFLGLAPDESWTSDVGVEDDHFSLRASWCRRT